MRYHYVTYMKNRPQVARVREYSARHGPECHAYQGQRNEEEEYAMRVRRQLRQLDEIVLVGSEEDERDCEEAGRVPQGFPW